VRILIWAFFATLSAILFVQLRGLDEPLHLTETPGGIVGYELAWDAPKAQAMIDAWKQNDAIEAAKVSLGVDFVFLLAYPLMFFYGAQLLVRTPVASSFDQRGAVLAKAVLACIPLDAVENLLLWRQLDGGASAFTAHLAAICAGIKFLLVILTALWCVAALGRRVLSPSSPSRS
jgi:hypothetical protein